jgi:hypothetical protein
MMKPDQKQYPKERQDHVFVYCIAAAMAICLVLIWVQW